MKTYVNDMDMRREGYVEEEKDAHRLLINKWLQKGKTVAEIAEDLGKSEEYVENLMKN